MAVSSILETESRQWETPYAIRIGRPNKETRAEPYLGAA